MLTHLKNSKSLEIEIYRGRRYSCPSLCPGTGGSCSHGKGSPRYLEDIHDWKIFVIYNFYRLFITTFTGQVYAFNKIAGDKVIWPNSHYLHCHCHYNRCHHHDAIKSRRRCRSGEGWKMFARHSAKGCNGIQTCQRWRTWCWWGSSWSSS